MLAKAIIVAPMDGLDDDEARRNKMSATAGRTASAVAECPEKSILVISANTFWNIENFRSGLIDALLGQGCELVVATPSPNIEWARKKGVRTVPIDIDRSGLNPFADVRLLLQYLQLFRSQRPKYYLGFTVKPNIYGAFASRLCGVNALPNVSGLGTAFMTVGPLSFLVGLLYRVAFQDCPIVFFQNADDRELFISRNIVRSEQARLLPGSGIDVSKYTVSEREPSEITFLLIGRLLGDKGVREFVDAARLLQAKYISWKFRLLGEVDEGNRSAIERAELDGWIAESAIEYLGHTEDVRPYIAASTAVVLPSYREGLPRSLLEAAAMGRPMIATDVPGNREVVRDGVNGMLCLPQDAQSLADAMLKLGQLTPPERKAMGLAGRKLVEDCYGEEKVISAYLDAMRQP